MTKFLATKRTLISFFRYFRSGEWEMAGGDGKSLKDFSSECPLAALALPATTFQLQYMHTPIIPKDCN